MLAAIVINTKTIPTPLGVGTLWLLLEFGRSINFFLSLKTNNLINLLLIKNVRTIRKRLIKNIIIFDS